MKDLRARIVLALLVLLVAGPVYAQWSGGGGGGLVVGGAISGTCPNGYVLYSNNGVLGCEVVSGSGTVTSIELTLPAWLSVTPSSITTSGTFAVTGTSELANLVLASPNGSPGAVTPRSLGTADIPNSAITYAKIQNESTVTLLGNPTGGSAAPSEITLGTGLSFFGSVLNSSGGTGVGVQGGQNISNIGDNATALPAASYVYATNTAMTAARSHNLPSSATQGAGDIEVVDAKQTVTSAHTLTLAAAGTDTLQGVTNGTIAITTAGGAVGLHNDGSGNWTITWFSNIPSQTFSIGTVSSGTTTINCNNGSLQTLTNGGAFTLAMASVDGNCIVRITNNGSAGTITPSGFSEGSNTGDTPDTTNTHIFDWVVTRIGGNPHYLISALQ